MAVNGHSFLDSLCQAFFGRFVVLGDSAHNVIIERMQSFKSKRYILMCVF
jgi:hypothetical protein